MIKANELRVGNYVWGVSDRIEVITEVKVDRNRTCLPKLRESESDNRYEDISPIVLTEEMLLNCDGEIKPYSIGIILDRFRFIWKDEYKYWYVIDAYSQSYYTKIEFVHEFQNFVFVLNGKELEVNL